MAGVLHIIEGSNKGRILPLKEGKIKTIVGRDVKCDIQIEDTGVSRQHFCIEEQGEKFVLQDMGSSNGTFVNGKQTLWQEITSGDTIHCGGTGLRFFYDQKTTEQIAASKLENVNEVDIQKQALKKFVRQALMQAPPEETGRISMKLTSVPPNIEENKLDIICKKDRGEPPFSEHKDVSRLSNILSTLYKVSELLNSQIGLKELLNLLLETALEVTKAERGCILLKRGENLSPETVAFHTINAALPSNIPISKTVVNLAIQQGIATVSSDALSDKNLCQDSSSIILNKIRSVMCVPLEGKEEILGAIYVDNLFTRNFFDNEDLELLRVIGRQAGVAIGRTLLQEKISKSEQKYRTIFEKAPFSIVLVSSSGRVLDINPSTYRSLGLPEGSGAPSSILDVFPNAQSIFQKLLQNAEPFEIKEFHTENINGKNAIFRLKGIPLFDAKKELEGAMIIAEDITEAKRLQSQIIHQDKMATIGLLGAGVAHEFNNIIGGMMGYAQLTVKKKGDQKEDGLPKIVIEQCKRAHEVVDRLLNFSRKDETPKGPVKLDELLEDVFQLVSRELAKNQIQVVRHVDPTVPSFIGQAGQLQQVFLNLVINAVYAMDKGGTLTVSINHDTQWIRVVFQDTGMGIPAKILSRIFEPFFTTKKNHGTGLGLAVSYSIIQGYGGEINVESKEGEGSIFTISLPLQ